MTISVTGTTNDSTDTSICLTTKAPTNAAAKVAGTASASARSVHDECERLVGHRETLCRTLRDQVGPATTRLQEAIVPLAAVRAAQASRELVAVVDARHALQVALTQAAAEVQRLQLCEHEVALQLIALGQGTLRLG